MCQDHGLLLFVEPKRFRDFISAGSQSMHMVCEQKHAHLLLKSEEDKEKHHHQYSQWEN